MPDDAKTIQKKLSNLADPQTAAVSLKFFKTGPGEYGAGDQFRGIRVPELRKLAKEYRNLPLVEVERLLHSSFHEDRVLALLILVGLHAKADNAGQAAIYEFYLSNTEFISNWDLVDCSASGIVGAFLSDKSRRPLQQLARSKSLWERRIAVIATFHFIKAGDFSETLRIARLLLSDSEDLIHKAVGWMLREVGQRDRAIEEEFLRLHYKQMPRTMLRYAIEKFPEPLRQKYLRGLV
jgi:3-methyladenine DNA glycosylase AlkD